MTSPSQINNRSSEGIFTGPHEESINRCGEWQHVLPCGEDPGKGNGSGLEVSKPSEEVEEGQWGGTWEVQNLKLHADSIYT